MGKGLARLIRGWDGQGVIIRYDRPSASWIYIALHDTTLGRPVGGTRMKSYGKAEEALRDAMRLAEGMTWKWAGIGFDFGGGKCVVDVPAPLRGRKRTSFFRRYGRYLESLDGAFATGLDLGTTPEDMDVTARETRYVFGSNPEGPGTVDPGPYTALGVFCGIRAALRHRFGEADPSGRTILIQGVGDVGAPLARLVAEAGARPLLSDLDEERARDRANELGGETVAPEDVFDTPCDVFAPCAVGGVLDDDTIPRLRCGVVAGSANNQLASSRHAGSLHRRGILYAPDHVVNAGGAIAFGLLHRGVREGEELEGGVRALEGRLEEIFGEAAVRDESPVHAARRLARRKLEAGPAS